MELGHKIGERSRKSTNLCSKNQKEYFIEETVEYHMTEKAYYWREGGKWIKRERGGIWKLKTQRYLGYFQLFNFTWVTCKYPSVSW